MISSMTSYRWASPEHPDPPEDPSEDQPLGVPVDPAVVPVQGHLAVWVAVDFTRTGRQRLPGVC